MNRLVLVCTAVLSVSYFALTASAAVVSFDFGAAATQSTGNINNVLGSAQNVAGAIRLSDGVVTTMNMTVTSPVPNGQTIAGFSAGPNTNGTTVPGAPANGFFSGLATQDNLFGHVTAFNGSDPRPLVDYLITGLDANSVYNFTFFASRGGVGDNRETAYTVGGTTAALDAANNQSNVAQLTATSSASGELNFRIAPGANNNNSSGFYYLGAMQIEGEFTAVPEPTSLGLFAMGGIGLLTLRRRRAV